MMVMMRLLVIKMKYFKISLCILLSALLIFGCAAVVHASDSYLALYGFSFTINDNSEATIHEYDDRSPEVNIPNTLLGARVVCIDDYAFFGDTSMTSLNLSGASYLKTIGVNAFYGCSSIKEVTIPSSVEMSYGSFNNCGGLETLVIEDGITAIPAQCFYNCGSLKKISLPSSVTEIGELAFGNCRSLTRLLIPNTVQSISTNAFSGCDDLVIYCTKESYALNYAQANNIRYVIIDSDYYLGDANCDRIVSIGDVTAVQRELADIPEPMFNEKAANVDGGELDVSDAYKIQCYVAGFDDQLGIGDLIKPNHEEYETDLIP